MALKVELTQRLDLGIQGEHNARVIRIDCTGWLQQFPNGIVSLYHKRKGDSELGVTGAAFDRETAILSWPITEYETYYDGDGMAEIRLTEGTSLKKKKRALTLVRPAVVNENGEEIDSNWQAMIDEVERLKSELATEAEAWAVGQRGGVDVPETDRTYHNNSKYYADHMGDVAQEYIDDIHAAGEEAKRLFPDPEDLSQLASKADVDAIKARFNNETLKIENGGTGANSVAQFKINFGLTNQNIVDLIYPVGSIYITAGNTNPQTIFGGTWEQIKDKFVLAAGDTYAAGATGGAAGKSYTPAGTIGGTALTVAQMPGHAHNYKPGGTISGGTHSHSYQPSGTLTAISPATHGHTFQGAAHGHTVKGSTDNIGLYIKYGSSSGGGIMPQSARWLAVEVGGTTYYVHSSSVQPSGINWEQLVTSQDAGGGTVGQNGTSGYAFNGTLAYTSQETPSMTFDGTVDSTYSEGSSAAHDHGFTGTPATIDTMPPYLAVNVWKRTA